MKLQDLFLEAAGADGNFAEGLRPQAIQNIIDAATQDFNLGATVQVRTTIPDTNDIPIQGSHWLKIPNVIACFVDMEGSTKLSATYHEKGTAAAYKYFTGTAIRIFHYFQASYIDVKGDGVFALFDQDQFYTALAATISFKTFVHNEFTPNLRARSKGKLNIGGHFGIDQKDVLVKTVGLRPVNGRSDRQNEVWAGKPVNMAPKLASLSTDNRLWVSDRYFNRLKDEKALYSCGCPDGEHGPLWEQEDVQNDDKFDFDVAYSLGSNWCPIHGKSFCANLVKLDAK